MSQRQMLMAFSDETPSADQERQNVPATKPTPTVAEIAASLRPQIAAYLQQAGEHVGIRQLRSEMGYSVVERRILTENARRRPLVGKVL